MHVCTQDSIRKEIKNALGPSHGQGSPLILLSRHHHPEGLVSLLTSLSFRFAHKH